ELAPEQRNEVLVVLERFGLASRGGKRANDQPMGVLAHTVERDGALAGSQGMLGASGSQLLFAEPHHGAKGKLGEPLALGRPPFAPALLADRNVVDEGTAVEVGCRTQRVAAALPHQGYESADVA